MLNRILFATFALLTWTSALAQAQPKLLASTGGQTVEDGDAQFLDPTLVGDSTQLVVVIRNGGDEDLVFESTPPVTLEDDSPGFYSLIQPALEVGNKLSPNSSSAFAIRFEPEARIGDATAFAVLKTNANSVVLKVSAQGIAPVMRVLMDGSAIQNDDTIPFDPTPVGSTDQIVFVVRNSGDSDLLFLNSPPVTLGGLNADQFSLIQPALESGAKLSPGSSTAFAVRYEPTAEPSGSHLGQVTLVTSDPEGPFQIQLGSQSVAAETLSWGELRSRY